MIGCNCPAAETIIGKFPKPTSSSAKLEFISCDVLLMRNVQETTKDLVARIPKINFLVMSPGLFSFKGRDETEEGIDKKMALHYYAQWKFIHGLAPALVRAEKAGKDAKVFSVLGVGKGGKVNLDDLGLKKTFSVTSAALEVQTYNDLMMEVSFSLSYMHQLLNANQFFIQEYAAQYPSISFIHACPGFVQTNLGSTSSSFLERTSNKLLNSCLSPFSYYATSKEDVGEYLLNGLLHTVSRSGAWRIGECGQDIGKIKYFSDEESQKKLWEHTVGVTGLTENPSS